MRYTVTIYRTNKDNPREFLPAIESEVEAATPHEALQSKVKDQIAIRFSEAGDHWTQYDNGKHGEDLEVYFVKEVMGVE